ncbi:MAG TPA: ATP-binding protein [Thermotogota bacterium]|nr:ATP-binding protein [Thermotogota bacterium]HPJ89871.1 ATP-binding protein [Thermotogota bacterium]HPR97128.1 ATP-binding protein [Thermotogota bacterium]
MQNSILRELINNLYDKPIGFDQKHLFIDREDELKKLQEIIDFQPQGVYGVCGETGVGKTSFLKQFMREDIKSYFIPISEKDNKETIISDFIFRLSTQVSNEKDKYLKEKALSLKKWVIAETDIVNNFSGGFNAIGSANLSHSKSEHKKFNIFEAKEKLDDLLNGLVSKHAKILLIIDELDKEKKEEVMLILDSMKEIITKDRVITVISLPFAIYREYSKDIMRWNEWGNLENIFKNMFFIRPLSEQNIREMLLKRISIQPTILPNDAYHEIFRYSNGNPRDALSITQEILLDNRETPLTNDSVLKTIKKRVSNLMEFSTSFTELQEELLKLISEEPTERSEIVKKAEEIGIKKTTVYTFIKRFLDNGFLKEKNGKIYISGRLYYYFYLN